MIAQSARSAQSRTTGMVTYSRRPRSLIGNLSAVLLQPVTFFRSLPATRQWVWVGLLMLIVTGFSAVHQPAPADSIPPGQAPAIELPPGAGIPPGGISGIDGGFIAPTDPGMGQSVAPAADVSKTVMLALLAASGVLVTWFIQALVLSEVSLINGIRPSFGLNLQITIWASVPLALMLVIQQLYFAAGGSAGIPGISLLLERWAAFQTLPTFTQTVLTTLTTNFTLFWLWNLALLYIGGRIALNGKRVAVTLVIVAWVIISVLVPALTSIGSTPSTTDDTQTIVPGGMEQFSSTDMEPMAPSDGSTRSESENAPPPAAPPAAVQIRPIIKGSGG